MSPDTVVVSCVTFETIKISAPINELNADRVHLLHYVRGSSESKFGIYQEFYDEVCRQIKEGCGAQVVEHIKVVYDFSEMLKEVMEVIASERGNDIYINVSAGTSEYVSAATLASMMAPETKAFTVSTKEYVTPPEELRDYYYKEGKPIGLSKEVYPLKNIPKYDIDMPDEQLIRGLRVLDKQVQARRKVSAKTMIEALKEAGLWDHAPDDSGKKTPMFQKEAMYYQRHFVDPWTSKRWAVKDPIIKKHVPTDLGKILIGTFYLDE